MVRRAMSCLAFALSLCAGSMAQAADESFLDEFRSICIGNMNDLTLSQATAKTHGFVTAVKTWWGRDRDGVRLFYKFWTVDTPADVQPLATVTSCSMNALDVPEAQIRAIGDWAAIPAVETGTTTDYRFRVVADRHVAVLDDDLSVAAALKLGPVFFVNVQRQERRVGVTLGQIMLRK